MNTLARYSITAVTASLAVLVGCAGQIQVAPSSSTVATSPAATLATPSPTLAAATGAPPSSPGARETALIAYQAWDGTNHIHLVRADGSADRFLVDGAHPDWSPDGAHIAYQDGAMDIWIVDVDGANAHRVWHCAGSCVLGDSPAWSPDGASLAFSTASAQNGEAPGSSVVVADTETGATRTLVTTTGRDYAFYPRWSPDGKKIVYTVQRYRTKSVNDCSPVGTALAVAEVAVGSAAPRMLTDFTMFADYPDWSPDGETVVFTTYDLGTRDYGCALDPTKASDLYTMRLDDGSLTQLTHNKVTSDLIRAVSPISDPGASPVGTASGPLSGQPSWADAGRTIIFTQVDGLKWPGWQIWTMDADGSDARRVPGPAGTQGTHARMQPAAVAVCCGEVAGRAQNGMPRSTA